MTLDDETSSANNETIDFIGKAVRLYSTDGPEVTVIDAHRAGTVVRCESGEGPETVLEGFTITDGFDWGGGGMYNLNSSPTVTNCTFLGNTAEFLGGGMYNRDSSPTVTDCTFVGNTTNQDGGGGMFNGYDSSPTVTNSDFIGNTPSGSGGGMYNSESSPTVMNCMFSGNGGFDFGGGMCNYDSSPAVTNCTFIENFGDGAGGMFNHEASDPTVTNCIFWGNHDEGIDGPATVTYSDVQGGYEGVGNINADPFLDDDGRAQAGSPSIDAANNDAVPGGITEDLDGNPRIVDDPDTEDTGNGTPPVVDMGAYEFQVSCLGDLDDDGAVDFDDLLRVLDAWGDKGGPEDLDGSGTVDFGDLLIVLDAWGPCE